MVTPKNSFTFRPIGLSYWAEHKDKSSILNPSNYSSRELKEQERKYNEQKNRRNYRIFKIEPVRKGNENYTLVAFPLFPNSESWGIEWHFNYFKVFEDNPGNKNYVENFAYKVGTEKSLKADEVPYFRLISSLPFQKKSLGEVNYIMPVLGKQNEVKNNLADGMSESDLILIAPVKDYEIIQVSEKNEEDEEENHHKKPDKNNHQCQAVHDKLHGWETKAKTKVLRDCQNDIHAGVFNETGVFAASEYAQYTVLTKKCVCGGQLKRNGYGDEMIKCSVECSGEEEEENNHQTVSQFRTTIKQTILKSLKENKLKTSDLPVEFQNWETDLERLNDKKEIKKFQQKLEKAIQEKKNELKIKQEINGSSLPVKLLIGGGVAIVLILGLVGFIWFKKRKS